MPTMATSFPQIHRRARLWRAAALVEQLGLALRARPAIVAGKKDSPLGSFYFGSFRNNYVDNRPEKRYRELESFPGFEIDEIDARRFAKLIGEVNLPPIRFAEVGTPSIYLSYARPALFAGAMLTHNAAGENHNYMTVGGQVDLAFTVALRLPMVLLGRRGARLRRRPLPKDRVPCVAEDHVSECG